MTSLDLRLVPAAAGAWVAAALALVVGPGGRLGLLAALAAAAGLGWRRPAVWLTQLAFVAVIAFAVVLSAHAQLHAEAAVVAALPDGAPGRYRAVALEPSRPLGPGSRSEAMVAVEIGSVRATALGRVERLATGDRVVIAGKAIPQPDRERSRVLLVDAEVLRAEPAAGLQGAVNSVRAGFLEVASGLGPQGQGLVPGIALGDDSRLPDTLEVAMRRSSLGHLTAVSGAHVALVLAIVGFLGSRAGARVRGVLLLAALGALVLLVGPGASVVRAAAMGVVAIVAVLRGRPPQPMPALAAGAVALLVSDPWLALSYGFALSVAATAALVCLAPPLSRRMAAAVGRASSGRAPERLVRASCAALALPLAAHLACAPIIIGLTPTVSTWGVLANLAAGPAVVPATVLSLAAVLVTPLWPPLALLLARGAELATGWIAGVALAASRLPGAALPWPGGWGGALALGALHLVAVVLLLRPGLLRPRRRRRGGPLAAVGALLVLALLLAALPRPGEWSVLQCDVGQGSATLVRTGRHSAIMVDVGTRAGASERCLAAAGIRRLDLLVLTHPHDDHVGNLAAVLAATDVRSALVSPAASPAATAAWVNRELRTAGVTPRVGTAGLRGAVGPAGSGWQVLWPAPDTAIRDANDLSLVVQFRVAGRRLLALGDLQGAGQAGLAEAVRSCGPPCQAVDVVVIAHHGSADQDQVLARLLDPAITVVPVGENTYGHPTASTLRLYRELGTRLWRTDRDGTITVSFTPSQATVRTGAGRG